MRWLSVMRLFLLARVTIMLCAISDISCSWRPIVYVQTCSIRTLYMLAMKISLVDNIQCLQKRHFHARAPQQRFLQGVNPVHHYIYILLTSTVVLQIC